MELFYLLGEKGLYQVKAYSKLDAEGKVGIFKKDKAKALPYWRAEELLSLGKEFILV